MYCTTSLTHFRPMSRLWINQVVGFYVKCHSSTDGFQTFCYWKPATWFLQKWDIGRKWVNRNLNSDSAQLQILLLACRRFAIGSISGNCPDWISGFTFNRSTISQKQFIIIIIITTIIVITIIFKIITIMKMTLQWTSSLSQVAKISACL